MLGVECIPECAILQSEQDGVRWYSEMLSRSNVLHYIVFDDKCWLLRGVDLVLYSVQSFR